MTEFFVNILLQLNNIFGNLGITIIFVGAASRLIFHPLIISNLRYTKAARDLKPKLDEVKKKYGSDMKRVAEEQSKLFKNAGVNPAAGALGCVSLLVQLIVFFLLFRALLGVLDSGVETQFLVWDLSRPDTHTVPWLPVPIPGILIISTAVLSLIQSKMIAFAPEPTNKPKKEGSDLTDFFAFQGQLVYLFPIVILISGTQFPAGLALYWLVITIFGIIQQYQALGWGGVEPWLQKIQIVK